MPDIGRRAKVDGGEFDSREEGLYCAFVDLEEPSIKRVPEGVAG